MRTAFKLLWGLCLILLLSAFGWSQGQPTPTGYVQPYEMAGQGPSGNFLAMDMTSGGALVVTPSSGNLNPILGYVQPIAPVAQDTSGVWHYLQVNGSGALVVSSGGSSSGGCIATVSTLSSACGTTGGTVASVTDGTTTGDCSVGGGTIPVVCVYNANLSTWLFAGAVGGTGAATRLAVWSGTGTLTSFGTLTSDSSGNLTANSFSSAGTGTFLSVVTSGTGAGLIGMAAGSDSGASCPANSRCMEAAATISTSWTEVSPSAGPVGPSTMTYTALSGGETTQSFTALSGLTVGVAANIQNGGAYQIPYNTAGSSTSFLSPNVTTTPEVLVVYGNGTSVTNFGYAAFVSPGGALGTPSSGVITNLTGTCTSCTANLAGGLTGTPAITVGQTTLTLGTVTSTTPMITGTETWNSGGTTFDNILTNITNTASANGSRLINLEVGGNGELVLDRAGTTALYDTLTIGNSTNSLGGKLVMAGSSSGSCSVSSNTGGTTITSSCTLGTSGFNATSAGALSKVNNETTAGPGVVYERGVTAQKSETGADTSVLSVTPATSAGTYCATFTQELSAASSATIGWTITYTDAAGNAQSPTNLALFQSGTAAPALTFTTSAAGNYYGYDCFDINNAGTAIVVKTTFSGTSMTSKVSAVIERKQ